MRPEDFDYFLPEELIAQHPLEERAASRLLVLHRDSGAIEHKKFPDIKRYIGKGDLMLFNDTRVIPARLIGAKPAGGKVEVLLIRRVTADEERGMEIWQCMVKPSKGIRRGTRVVFDEDFEAEAIESAGGGFWNFRFSADVSERIKKTGRIPLPPYIRREATFEDSVRYQTVFAANDGAVAAPTAGLHFTSGLLEEMRMMGVETRFLTLHTGPATFMPLREGDISRRAVPEEQFSVSPDVAASVARARAEGRRVIAVGSTVTRAIETVFRNGFDRPVLEGGTDMFIYPGFAFRVVSALVTNFHLPRSTLLMLVAAFAGRENIMMAYREAVERRYRFFSYGDCMMVV